MTSSETDGVGLFAQRIFRRFRIYNQLGDDDHSKTQQAHILFCVVCAFIVFIFESREED
jgi:hypothetical protein